MIPLLLVGAGIVFLLTRDKTPSLGAQGGSAVLADMARLQATNPAAFAAVNAQLGAPNKIALASFAQQMFTAGFPALAADLNAKSVSMPG